MKNEKDSIEKAFSLREKRDKKVFWKGVFLKGIKQRLFFQRKNQALSS